MAMMGEVSDWGEREKKGLKYFLKFFLQNWRDVKGVILPSTLKMFLC